MYRKTATNRKMEFQITMTATRLDNMAALSSEKYTGMANIQISF